MQQHPIFTGILESHAAQLWGQEPICISHRLHESPLFARDSLAALIESYPRQHYGIIHMGARDSERRYWREGDLNGLSGEQVLEAISTGRLWLNLRNTGEVDHRYKILLDQVFGELEQNIPKFSSNRQKCGILLSSPGAQVYYHSDMPGQMLFQISGRKRVYVYPPKKPFITAEDLQRIAIFGLEVDLPYYEWYDEYARVFEFEPGQMLHWPHNAPHRIENHDCLNISMTVEFSTDPIRRAQIANRADGILRYRLGWRPRGTAVKGPVFWAKAAVWVAFRKTSWFKKQGAVRRRVEFLLDGSLPGAVREISPATYLRTPEC
ncbi:MAG: cupin-like domain-containing protein [Methylocella sp.]